MLCKLFMAYGILQAWPPQVQVTDEMSNPRQPKGGSVMWKTKMRDVTQLMCDFKSMRNIWENEKVYVKKQTYIH